MRTFWLAAVAIGMAAAVPTALAQPHPSGGHPAGGHPAAVHLAPAMHAPAAHFHAAAHRPASHHAVRHRVTHSAHHHHTTLHHVSHHAGHVAHVATHVSAKVAALRKNVRAAHRFHAGAYRAPPGYHYRRWSYGEMLPAAYWGRDYWITDFLAFGLFAPPPDYIWVRYGPDALLIDQYTGAIIQVDYDVFY
ncbi:MAG TPA: RcnB family protein [Rhizomicrobium sp.]|nr:RcnB family protein [Rhizomicrobium sp.]